MLGLIDSLSLQQRFVLSLQFAQQLAFGITPEISGINSWPLLAVVYRGSASTSFGQKNL